jgi:hypothetical protein
MPSVRKPTPLPIGRLPSSSTIVLLRSTHLANRKLWGCGRYRAECWREARQVSRYRVWDELTGEVRAEGSGSLRGAVERECLERMAEVSGGKVEG